jgi:hypothetical protein
MKQLFIFLKYLRDLINCYHDNKIYRVKYAVGAKIASYSYVDNGKCYSYVTESFRQI